MRPSVLTAAVLLTASFVAPTLAASRSETEASSILAAEAKASGRPAYGPGHGVNFKPSDHVFVKSALAVDFTYRSASVTLPLFQGRSPSGKDEYFIITDASDFEIARMMGVNYAPKLTKARGTAGVQDRAVRRKRLRCGSTATNGPCRAA